ncbi:Stress response protein nst1, partial [Lunasporangiospora selenospora]
MAAHTFAPEDALPPPKSAVIYSRDGRKRSLNIDMSKHFAYSQQHDHHPHSTSQPPPLPATITSLSTVVGHGSGSDQASMAHSYASNGLIPTGSSGISSSNKRKKKRSKKKTALDRIEDSGHWPNEIFIDSPHEHHAGCHHGDGHYHEFPRQHQHHDLGHHSNHLHQFHHYPYEHGILAEDGNDVYSDEDAYDPETPSISSAAGIAGPHGSSTAPSPSNKSQAQSGSSSASKKKKKKKKKSAVASSSLVASHTEDIPPNGQHEDPGSTDRGDNSMARRGGQLNQRTGQGHGSLSNKHIDDNHVQSDGFWTLNDAEERQRIREFWFQLREDERRSLVRVEKEAVLKKMKEQQRHSCSCSLCGRKRTAIEEELELLYDAYYDELEQYANQQHPSDSHALTYPQPSPSFEDDDLSDESRDDEDEDDEDAEEEDEEGYEDEDDEEYEDEVNSRKAPFPYRGGFPNTLQAKGNILTVAEDLLENDGKKFLEMMDRLADRKVQRDDELMDNRAGYDDYDEDEEGEYEEDGVEEDAMTKEQRMEEGRRMFQAFAARMFEQRVLSAYREKVAQERQERLLAELEEESRQEQLREEKREREKERRRDKKRLQRQQKEEERAAKEALRLAEEKRQLEEREKRLEADRKKKEEERRAKEEEKRLREEERARKEEERVKKEEERKRKQKEEKARETERERKRREDQLAKEKEEQTLKEELVVKEESKRLEREAFLKQQLLEEKKRHEELLRIAEEEISRQEEEERLHQAESPELAESSISSPLDLVNRPVPLLAQDQNSSTSLEPTLPSSTSAPLTGSSTSPAITASPARSSNTSVTLSPITPQAPMVPTTSSLWSQQYPSQSPHPSHHAHMPQHQVFPPSMQQEQFSTQGHFGQIPDADAFLSRVGQTGGLGAFNPMQLQPMQPLQPPAGIAQQHMGGLRSSGLPPIGYGQSNVPPGQLLGMMNSNTGSIAHGLPNAAGSPLHSPPALGAIGTSINSFGSFSPLGHVRRTSTPHGSMTSESNKRPTPIGRPKDQRGIHGPGNGTISNSFEGISLDLQGLTIGSSGLERRPRSPPMNLTGSSLELNGDVLGKDPSRLVNGVGTHLGQGYPSDMGPNMGGG